MTENAGMEPEEERSPQTPTPDQAKRLYEAALGGTTTPPPQQAHEEPVEAPQEIAGDFPQLEILEVLGRGGMGVVYKARQPALDRIVVLKVLHHKFSRDPQFVERFTREARALARLNHPNIVSVYDFGESNGRFSS